MLEHYGVVTRYNLKISATMKLDISKLTCVSFKEILEQKKTNS